MAVICGWTGCGAPDTDGVSRFGRRVLEAGGDNWERTVSDHLVCYVQSMDDLRAITRKAEFAFTEAGRALDLPLPAEPAYLYVLSDTEAWLRLQRRAHLRFDGIALQSGMDFVILNTGTNFPLRDDIPHEVVHLRLRQAYGDRLPLALEEGLAVFIGWEINLSYHLLHGEILSRSEATIPHEHLLLLEELTTAERYPAEPARTRAFYRQAALWVRAIAGLIGEENLGTFVRSVAQGEGSWQEILNTKYEADERDLAMVRRAVELSRYEGYN
jgi:hypothetical protein